MHRPMPSLFSPKLRTLSLISKSLITLLCFFSAAITFTAQANDVLTLNDLEYNIEKQQYRANGNDPFLTFKPTVKALKNSNHGSENQYLAFDLKLNQASTSAKLFFNSKNGGFNPQYFIEFKIPANVFTLKIPTEINLGDTTLRLDLEQCPNCQFSFKGAQLKTLQDTDLESTDLETSDSIVEPTLFKNGSLTISNSDGYDIDNSLWRLNDLDGDISKFNVNGKDPFIASSTLDVSSKGLGGVYLKLTRPESPQHLDFQLFYATENHPFTGKYSSIIRHKPNNIKGTNENLIEMLVPLDYLGSGTPKDHILKNVRLDLPVIEGDWSLISSKLIHVDQLNDYAAIIPIKLIQKKRQRLRGKSLIIKALNNVWRDKVFSITFILLLLLVSVLFYRSFKK